MSRPTPRRPASSRGGTQRPRRIAGQAPSRTSDELTEPAEPVHPTEPFDRHEHRREDRRDDALSRPGVLARPKTTRVLIIALAILALLLAGQAVWWIRHDDDANPRAVDETGSVSVPADRPVLANEVATLDGVEAAAKAAQEIVAVDFQKYDAEVDAAAGLMTATFEEQYRTTAADIREEFVANRTVVQANVVAQGVVRANRTRLEALVFLNQVVSRERDGEPETVVTPYKVLVTMVHTDQGWFVDGLDTDAPRDKTN
ncbi:MAG TPA: hypothetical protein VNT31_15055 [Nocardioides sp.]|nr:hypothetical protein [Nocardioides sp.]